MAIHDLTPPNSGGERYCSPRSQPGPVTLALRAMRAADPDQAAHDAIEAIRRGLDRHFSEADWKRLKALRQRVAARIEFDLALLDVLAGDADLEDGHDQERENEHGGDIQDEPHDPEEDMGADADGDFPSPVQFDGYNYHPLRAR